MGQRLVLVSQYVTGDSRVDRALNALALRNLQNIRRLDGACGPIAENALLGKGIEVVKAVCGQLRLVCPFNIGKEEQLILQAPLGDGNQWAANAAAKIVDVQFWSRNPLGIAEPTVGI